MVNESNEPENESNEPENEFTSEESLEQNVAAMFLKEQQEAPKLENINLSEDCVQQLEGFLRAMVREEALSSKTTRSLARASSRTIACRKPSSCCTQSSLKLMFSNLGASCCSFKNMAATFCSSGSSLVTAKHNFGRVLEDKLAFGMMENMALREKQEALKLENINLLEAFQQAMMREEVKKQGKHSDEPENPPKSTTEEHAENLSALAIIPVTNYSQEQMGVVMSKNILSKEHRQLLLDFRECTKVDERYEQDNASMQALARGQDLKYECEFLKGINQKLEALLREIMALKEEEKVQDKKYDALKEQRVILMMEKVVLKEREAQMRDKAVLIKACETVVQQIGALQEKEKMQKKEYMDLVEQREALIKKSMSWKKQLNVVMKEAEAKNSWKEERAKVDMEGSEAKLEELMAELIGKK